MVDEVNQKDTHAAGSDRAERAAIVSERLRAAKSEMLAATPEAPPENPMSLKPLFIGIGAILGVAVIWMLVSGGDAPVEVREPEPVAEKHVVSEPRNSVALEAARQARERVKAAEDAARQAREHRAALEAQQAAQRQQEAELARQQAEEQAAALAAAQEEAQRQALEAQQARVRRAAAARAEEQERARQQALAAQREREKQAALAAEQARQAELAARQEQERLAAAEAAERARQAALAAEQAVAEPASPVSLPVAAPSDVEAPVVAIPEAAASEQDAAEKTDVFRQARPGGVKAVQEQADAEVEFSPDPCKGPSAKFLSTCR